MKLQLLAEHRLSNPGKCNTCKFSSYSLEYGAEDWDCTHKYFEKQNRLKEAGWKIGSAEDFLNDLLEVSINKYLLTTSKSEFLCFSPISNEYYLSTTKNSDLVVLCSPQKEQETIKLYSDLMRVFLTPVLS